MIKNLLYSLFIHFILFSAIYFAFSKTNKNEIEAEEEILVSLLSLDSKGIPPINEIANQTPIENKSQEDISSNKEPLKKEILEKQSKDEKPLRDNEEKPLETINELKNRHDSNKNIAKNELNLDKIIQKISKEIQERTNETKNNSIPKNPTPTTNSSKSSKSLSNQPQKNTYDKNTYNKNSNEENDEFFKVVNLKPFKNTNNEEVGSTLTARETINIQSQLKICYKRAIEESGFESRDKIIIKIQISKDGYIENDLDEIIDIEKYNNPQFKDYKIIIDNIKRALDLCSPLRNLPADKYESWKEIILQFDFNNNSKRN